VKRVIKIIVQTLFIASLSVNVAVADEYHLDAGDVLTIGVWGFGEQDAKDLQAKEYMVRPDGKVDFPLVGEVQAAGISSAELTGKLTTGLSYYLKDPKVTVNVFKLHTTRVYVLGKVEKPGMYELEKQHNLLDAIGAAGSYTAEAAKKKVYIIRKDQKGTPIKVNLMNIWEKGDMTQNYALGDGDVVYLSDNGQVSIPAIISNAYQLMHFNN